MDEGREAEELVTLPAVIQGDYPTLERYEAARHVRERQGEFLTAYRRWSGKPSVAARHSKIPLGAHYYWIEHDPIYRREYDRLRRCMADELEGAVYERALAGVEKPVVSEGKVVGSTKEYDVRREALILRGLKPETYAPKLADQIGSETLEQVAQRIARIVSKNGKQVDPKSIIDAEFDVAAGTSSQGAPPPGGAGRFGGEGGEAHSPPPQPSTNPPIYSPAGPIPPSSDGTPVGGSHP